LYSEVGFEVITAASLKVVVFWVVSLMIEAASTSETLVKLCQITRRYNTKDSHMPYTLKADGI
jgi:hypothetical protein